MYMSVIIQPATVHTKPYKVILNANRPLTLLLQDHHIIENILL